MASLEELELKPFEFRGHLGNRRVISFGLRYDYSRRTVETASDFPSFLEELRAKVAEFYGRGANEFRQAGINEYRPGARMKPLRMKGAVLRLRPITMTQTLVQIGANEPNLTNIHRHLKCS